MFNRLVKYFLENRLVTFIFLIAFVVFGIVYTPFNWHTGLLPRNPIPVDAIPDIGDNQQIVATEWMGQTLALIYLPELITAQQELKAAKTKQEQPEIYETAKERLHQWKLTESQIVNIESSGNVQNNFEMVSIPLV